MQSTPLLKTQLTYLIILCFSFLANAQNIVINEFVSSNTTYFDEDNEASDWIEIYNVGLDTSNLSGWFLSDKIDSLTKWELPDINIYPAQTVLFFASGKDRKVISQYESIIDWGDDWSYKIGSAEIPANWNTLAYNAADWEIGPSGFGFGDNDDATLVPDNTLSIFVRKSFNINTVDDVNELVLHIDYDDGFIAYINGKEIARENLGTNGSSVAWNQPATSYTEPFIPQGLPPKAFKIDSFKDFLQDGENILSIQVHNSSTTSSDITLIPFLSIAYNTQKQISKTPNEILQLKGGKLHTNFKISNDGEALFLTKPDLSIADQTDSIPLEQNISYGRKPDGTGSFFYFSTPTPNALNQTIASTGKSENDLTFSHQAGKYRNSISLKINSASGGEIYYTVDGSDPNTSSKVYSSTLNVSKTTAFKFIVVSGDHLPSDISTASYIITDRDIELPIVSITTNPDNFFDYNYGILEKGPNAEGNFPYFNANFWNDWERPIHFEYIDEEGKLVYQSNAGTKVFGGWSRGMDQKSLAIFARKEYGNSSFEFNPFKTKDFKKYKSFVLRNAGNDNDAAMCRDAVSTSLVANLNIDLQAYQPTVVYINGEYWGILNLREKVNEDYLESNHSGVNSKAVDILQSAGEIVEGTEAHYFTMIEFIEQNNLSNTANYEQVKQWMDIDNFIQYQIAQIYFDNRDWPGNNIKFWRPQTENGKWRWILYDTDFGFGRFDDKAYESNTLDFATAPNGPDWPNPSWSTFLLRKLLENKDFKNTFINQFADRLNNEFKHQVAAPKIDSIFRLIKNEIPSQNERWGNLWSWDDHVQTMRTFAKERPTYMRNHLRSEFSLSGQYVLTLTNSETNQGYLQVNSITINSTNWSGTYFKNVPISVTAIAKPGYQFKAWLGSDKTTATIVEDFNQNTSIEPIFEPVDKDYDAIVFNEINYNSNDESDAGDWVELYNTTNAALNLAGWVFQDNDTNAFVIPKGTIIEPRGYLVLVKNANKFDAIHPTVKNRVGAFGFGLGSDYEVIKLYNASKILIDSVFYESTDPWPKSPNGEGYTLASLNPFKDNTPHTNWSASIAVNGTPGRKNDHYVSVNDNLMNSNSQAINIKAYPNPFLNETQIQFYLNSNSYINIEIIDFKGAVVQTLIDSEMMPGEHMVSWNPKSNDSQNLPAGLYFVKITTNHANYKVLKLMYGN